MSEPDHYDRWLAAQHRTRRAQAFQDLVTMLARAQQKADEKQRPIRLFRSQGGDLYLRWENDQPGNGVLVQRVTPRG